MLPKQDGFTLIELVMIIIIMSILSVGVYISWPAGTLNLSGQINQLADDIRFAQALSMAKDDRYRLAVTSSTTYQIQNSSGTPVTLSSGNTSVTLNSTIVFGTLTNLPNSLVAFDGQGQPYSTTGTPGTALASTATIALVSGSETRTVSIAPQTGRVLVQ